MLASHGPERTIRRAFNEAALETDRAVHCLAESLVTVVEQEMRGLGEAAAARGGLIDWNLFIRFWFCMVRSVTLGHGARDDEALTAMQESLRRRANWGFVAPQDRKLRQRFHERLKIHLARAEEGSLAGRIAKIPSGTDAEPSQQVAQWLFAFDPAGMATFRTLAVLATHADHFACARREAGDRALRRSHRLPYLRACFFESLRVWPTTPMILRQSTTETAWDNGRMPADTAVLIFTPYFHRDGERLASAHRFEPGIWLGTDRPVSLVPFSAGPAICPAHNLVPMLAAAAIATLIDGRHLTLERGPALNPQRPLPGTLDNYTLRIRYKH